MFPDAEAEKLSAAALRLGVSVDEVARSLVADHLPAVVDVERSRLLLEGFLGSVAGDGSSFDVHEARWELAARRSAQGTRNL